MIRSKFFSRFIVVTLTAALLLVSGSRAIRVSALAQTIVPELAPVFDTQIYQLQDYIDHGGMTDPQLDIFYMLCGFYALGQAGSEDYKLTNPYSTQGGVLNWLKDVGVETYNTLIGLAPDTVVLPNGSIQSTDVLKKAASMYVANLMGCALKAVDYDTVQEFEDDLNNSTNFYIPWNKSTQYGLNTIFQTYGGIYNWQFTENPFVSNVSWYTKEMTSVQTERYNDILYNTLSGNTKVRGNLYATTPTETTNRATYNVKYSNIFFDIYTNILINTSNNTIQFYDDSGSLFNYFSPELEFVKYSNSYPYSNQFTVSSSCVSGNYTYNITYNPANYTRFIDIIHDVYDFVLMPPNTNNRFFFEDFIQHVYVGSSWANRQEIFNVIDLNFDDTGTDYYVAPSDDDNYLLDIKGILNDILNELNLYGVFIDNLFSLDGVPVHDTDLIRITTDIYDLLNQQNPPLPVNLNDIVEYTDNTYLDRLKEHARNFGDIFAAYVAFWHNADHDLVYTLFGASIMVLIGAFIGKWGHS